MEDYSVKPNCPDRHHEHCPRPKPDCDKRETYTYEQTNNYNYMSMPTPPCPPCPPAPGTTYTTPNYHLPQWGAGDITSWLTQLNMAMLTIDRALHRISMATADPNLPDNIVSSIEDLETKLEKLGDDVLMLTTRQTTTEELTSNLSAQIVLATESLETVKRNLVNLDTKHNTLAVAVHSLETGLMKVQNNLTTLTERVDAIDKDLKAKAEQITELQNKDVEIEAKVTKNEADITALQTKDAELDKKIKANTDMIINPEAPDITTVTVKAYWGDVTTATVIQTGTYDVISTLITSKEDDQADKYGPINIKFIAKTFNYMTQFDAGKIIRPIVFQMDIGTGKLYDRLEHVFGDGIQHTFGWGAMGIQHLVTDPTHTGNWELGSVTRMTIQKKDNKWEMQFQSPIGTSVGGGVVTSMLFLYAECLYL